MKIALLSTLYPFRGGIAQFNAALFNEFKKNHTTKAYTFTRQYPNLLFPGQTQYVTESDNAEVIESEEVLDSINPLSYYLTARKINLYRPDLLIAKFWMPFFAPSLGYVSKKLRKQGTKSIAIIDNLIPHEKRIGDLALVKYFINRFDAFVVMSKVVEQDLLRVLPKAQYVLHPHPIYDHFAKKVEKEKALNQLNLPQDKKILLFFGFIRKYKGLDILLRSMRHLSDDYLLLVAGEIYGSFDEYQKIIDEEEIAGKVSLHIRYINDDEVPLFFSAADVTALPYKSATQSGIAQIAMHYELPLIVTQKGGLPELIEHEKTGLILKNEDAEELARLIDYYFQNNCKSKFASEIAKQKDRYSWPQFTQSLLTLYEQLS
ncbi:glycosyltransferase [candidate division KSB1 bacterium]|nr:glycosyltransferase [candidate division KSB1 bacterium]